MDGGGGGDDDDVSLPYMSLIDGKMKSLRHTENDNETTISNSNEMNINCNIIIFKIHF